MEVNNLFDAIPDSLENEVFDLLIENNTVKIERIVSKGHSSPESGWYDQDTNEWVVVLEGNAVIAFENDQELTLQAGSYINIPPHTKHKVSWTNPDRKTVWLAIHY